MSTNDLSGIGGAGSGGISSGPGGTGITIGDVYAAYRVEFLTIGVVDIANGYKALGASPVSSGKVHVDVMEGTNLQLGVDYNVDTINDRIDWNGLGLDGIIASGDVIRVVYFA